MIELKCLLHKWLPTGKERKLIKEYPHAFKTLEQYENQCGKCGAIMWDKPYYSTWVWKRKDGSDNLSSDHFWGVPVIADESDD